MIGDDEGGGGGIAIGHQAIKVVVMVMVIVTGVLSEMATRMMTVRDHISVCTYGAGGDGDGVIMMVHVPIMVVVTEKSMVMAIMVCDNVSVER